MDVRSVFSDKQLLAKISREYEILKVSGEDSHGFLIPTQNVTEQYALEQGIKTLIHGFSKGCAKRRQRSTPCPPCQCPMIAMMRLSQTVHPSVRPFSLWLLIHRIASSHSLGFPSRTAGEPDTVYQSLHLPYGTALWTYFSMPRHS